MTTQLICRGPNGNVLNSTVDQIRNSEFLAEPKRITLKIIHLFNNYLLGDKGVKVTSIACDFV